MQNAPRYFAYRDKIYNSGGGMRQAKLLSARPDIKGIFQKEPYGVDIDLTYQINPKFTPPDNYVETHGFRLYSKKLIDLLKEFGVEFESFPVKMVDLDERQLPQLDYHVFHLLEDAVPALDITGSGFDENLPGRMKRLVLDMDKFEHRPIILLDKLFFTLMREDLKLKILEKKITGFSFLPLEEYVLDEFGFPPHYRDE